ncbi:MAG: amidinotransferase [Elusimicrobia bacterium]|nr:amidinotransferase [Elusimicrobiota bacterium]
MNTQVYSNANELRGFSVKNCAAMPSPGTVLMCPPDHYDVVDVKNPFMVGKAGTVDKAAARAQWDSVREAYAARGKTVKLVSPVEGLEDMVFCSNTAMVGLTTRMERVCLLSRMRHPSRRREVPYIEQWFKGEGYRIQRLSDETAMFEGMGDCVWHPGKRLLWGGYGFRSDPEVYPEVAQAFEAPVILLRLVNERFYHLDTCFCPLNQEAVLIYPSAFDPESLGLILKIFPIVLVAEEAEATRNLACNAAVIDSKSAILQKGSDIAMRHIHAIGLETVPVDTTEFIKSGGSVFCLRLPVF